MYAIKEIFYTLQGEGAQSGRAAVFCRFAGCNLWSGRAADRAAAICKFCDTDFADTHGPGGGKFASAEQLARAVEEAWITRRTGQATAGHSTALAAAASTRDDRRERRFVVCTGGEPLLQLDVPLIAALHARGFEIAVETNGTVAAPDGLDWICVSPKAGAPLQQHTGHELKLVYPQAGAEPEQFAGLAFRHFFVQPMDGPARAENTRLAIDYCLSHPQWRVSLQTHKLMGIP
jgi:7-carboxy-7-deazaguanine synthase (Cx14CxxC type)